MANSDRQKKYRDRNKELNALRESRRRSTKGMSNIEYWTQGIYLLTDADGDDFDGITKCFCSYGPSYGPDDNGEVCFTYIGPTFGPLRIYGENARKAFNRVAKFN